MENEDPQKKQILRQEYLSRINRVIDYIEGHLDQELTLETLARVASFSRFHFHRIFGAMTGETLCHFIQRLRVEKAANQLLLNPKKSITEIAIDCGFSGSATFARAFRDSFQMTASEWRAGGHEHYKKDRRQSAANPMGHAKNAYQISDFSIDPETHQPRWKLAVENKDHRLEATVEVKEMPELEVAYVRHVGPYAGQAEVFEKIFGKLMAWAAPRGYFRPPETFFLSVYHDDPEVTEEEKLRVSACINIPAGTEVSGEIGKMKIAGDKYVMATFELSTDQYGNAWAAVMAGWFPESGYQPGDQLCYELYLNDPKQHPQGKHVVGICVPVKPL